MTTETTKKPNSYTQTNNLSTMHELAANGAELISVVVTHYKSDYGQLHASELTYFMRFP